jgi:hypothetical protein
MSQFKCFQENTVDWFICCSISFASTHPASTYFSLVTWTGLEFHAYTFGSVFGRRMASHHARGYISSRRTLLGPCKCGAPSYSNYLSVATIVNQPDGFASMRFVRIAILFCISFWEFSCLWILAGCCWFTLLHAKGPPTLTIPVHPHRFIMQSGH